MIEEEKVCGFSFRDDLLRRHAVRAKCSDEEIFAGKCDVVAGGKLYRQESPMTRGPEGTGSSVCWQAQMDAEVMAGAHSHLSSPLRAVTDSPPLPASAVLHRCHYHDSESCELPGCMVPQYNQFLVRHASLCRTGSSPRLAPLNFRASADSCHCFFVNRERKGIRNRD